MPYAPLTLRMPEEGLFDKRPLAPDSARKALSDGAASLFDHLDRLRAILERHESTIQKRWLKKGVAQRVKMLKKAEPEIPERHRPDIQYFIQRRVSTVRPNTLLPSAARRRFIYPEINLEDLSKARPLLLFLKSRGRNLPEKFVALDTPKLRFAQSLGITPKQELHGHVAIMQGSAPETYGRLIVGDLDKSHNLAYVDPGEAILLLMRQRGILQFLLRISELILHDIPDHKLFAAGILTEPLSENPQSEPWLRKSTLQLEAPYLVPQRMPLGSVRDMVRGRVAEAHEHLHCLKEDPSYFARTVREHGDYHNVTFWGDKPVANPDRSSHLYWTEVVPEVLSEAIIAVIERQLLHECIMQYESTLQQYELDLDQGSAPRSNWARSVCPGTIVGLLRTQLNSMLLDVGQKVYEGWKSSPANRLHAMRSAGETIPTQLMDMLTDGPTTEFLGLANILNELQCYLDKNGGAKSIFAPWLCTELGNLDIILQVLNELIDGNQWAKTVHAEADKEMRLRTEDIALQVKLDDRTKLENELTEASQMLVGPDFLNRKIFHYPIEKKRSKHVVEAMREAEADLDDFWYTLLAAIYQKHGATAKAHELVESHDNRPILRTPPWTETPEHKIMESKTDSLEVELNRLELERRSEGTLLPTKTELKRDKLKTRKSNTSETLTEDAAIPVEPTLPEAPRIIVGKKAYKVFAYLFFIPQERDAAGELPWTDFLAAMSSIGFRVQKLYGSIWQFTPTELNMGSSIQIHEPHPVAKLTFWEARRVGRRLTRHFGWTAEIFVRA